jgi:hypothetical protein
VASEALRHEDLLSCRHGALVERQRIERFVGDDASLGFRSSDLVGIHFGRELPDPVLVIVEPVDEGKGDRSVKRE